MNPVLTRGAPDEVEIWMIKVGDTEAEARDAPTAIGAHGLRLPASFPGGLPCPDCESLRYRLNLWPDQVFHLRRTWSGKDVLRDSIGRWSVDPDRRTLTLRGADEELRAPDRRAGPAAALTGEDGEDYAADRRGRVPRPSTRTCRCAGMLTYVGDEARFTECLTGRDYPLVRTRATTRRWSTPISPPAPRRAARSWRASTAASCSRRRDDGRRTVPKVLVERFVGVWPGETCERAGEASLTNTYWKILRLGEAEVTAGEGRREPNLILREGDPRFTATVGCNQISGGYTLDDDRLAFEPGPPTLMACPPPLDDWERQLGEVLAGTASWRIDGQTLELLDGGGQSAGAVPGGLSVLTG